MGITVWLRVAVLLAGSSLAAYGCYVLATGRLSDRSRASFRSTSDAGMYPLCSGVGLMLLAGGQFASQIESRSIVLTLGATALALVFMGLAFFRYRPRRSDPRP
ncbi:hypothetical protein [Jidongwangia harbinensis]|uniref:hypothetical protein n=1 Tax=Jidongwangia harbinensis TaxID=2878561 RepID=UPI001CD953B0|nr:hypothetical protein [Jidongwangia harbinensis]MCA2219054.1 hypothetical protein [Jidongwangia harbinensis]